MKQKHAVRRLADKLQQPMQECRPIPFWSWNDHLDSKELSRQIELMAKSGVGGYFMHARGGLQTDYLEQPWFNSIATGIESGKENGLNPWVYDEEGWPSGFAGGKVTALGEWVYARGLRIRRIDSPEVAVHSDALLGIFACTENYTEAVPISEMETGTTYTSYLEMTQSYSPFYIDVMNEKAVCAFIDCTHEAYADRFQLGDDGGLHGFFTDEPRFSEGQIPWSNILPDKFQKRYGYSLLENLPALYLPCGNYRKVRHDFWALANDLFVNAYMKQIFNWCEKHNCKLTGHMMMEESLYSQMTGTGGVMPFYEFMHQPGVDSLRRAVNDPRIPKQVGSVAEQLGKKHVLTESYAMSGWDLNFSEMRWIAGWQFVNGVNLMCQHLQAYSLKGLRKRDYPPSLFYQQTWYDEYNRFNDYLARLGQMLSEGKKHIDVLMIHPMHSGWVSYDGTNNEEIRALDEAFIHATLMLSGSHIDYHFGDETILKRHGRLLPDGRLQVGEYTYRAIVVPSSITLDRNTVDLLNGFHSAGHTLVKLGQWPILCEGETCDELEKLGEKAMEVHNIKELRHALLPSVLNSVSICENGQEASDIHLCQITLPTGGTALYLVNMNREKTHHVTITLPGTGSVSVLALDTLEEIALPFETKKDSTTVSLDFAPMETAVLVYDVECSNTVPVPKSQTVISVGSDNWNIKEMDDNLLTLDTCTYAIDGGEWQPQTPVIHLMQKLLDAQRTCNIRQRFTFQLQCDPKKLNRLYFVMEQPKQFTVTVNGHTVDFKNDEWYKDISFHKISILPYIEQGENVIEIQAKFYQSQHVYDVLYGENIYETELNKLTYDMELESVYLLGNFGVYSDQSFIPGERNSLTCAGPFVLDTLPQNFDGGCFTQQGLPFFAGRITVEKNIQLSSEKQEITLDFGHPRAALVKAKVNGKDAGTFLWGAYQCDASNLVQQGNNVVTLTLYASNRNMLGPHHHSKGENYSVGPLSFTGKFSWADRESEAVVITPEMRKQDFWQDAYSFVTFGLF